MAAPRGHGAAKPRTIDHTAQQSNRPGQTTHIPSIDANLDGLFVPVFIHGKEHKFLVDTGATDSYVSRKLYTCLPENERPSLQRQFKTAKLADGSSLPIDGVASFELTIGPTKGFTKLLVADISNDGILGLDNLTKMGAKIDLSNFQLSTKWGTVNCQKEDGESLFCRIQAAETTTIPAGHEAIIMGTTAFHLKPNQLGLLEAGNDLEQLAKKGIIVARTLINTGEDTVPIRVFNPSSSNKVIQKNTRLGTLTIIDEEEIEASPRYTKENFKGVPEHLQDLFSRSKQEVPNQYHQDIVELLAEFQDIFSKGSDDLGKTNLVKHHINTGPQPPIRQRPRRHPIGQRGEIKEQVQELLEKDLIEPTDSPWAANVVLVRKKDGTQRFCVDYRQLNAATIKDAYPLPRIDDTLDALSGVMWFSTLDLASGYWQVGLDEDAKAKSAFLADGGLYAWNVMPFGLCNAPATFERLMDKVLTGLHWETLLVYLDDLIIFGKSIPEELTRLRQVFHRLRQANLKLKPKKCDLFKTKVSYLGHEVSSSGISTQPEKTETIESWPVPTNVTEVRSFLGLASYYRRFVQGFATIAKPLHQLTEKGRQFVWSPACQSAFEELKQRLTTAPILAYPNPNDEYILDTDASRDGIGGVLSQVQDGQERVIAYGSKVLSKAERNYCVTRRELLAVVTYLKHFKQYLYGRHVRVRTDHGALRWLTNFKQPEGQLARWLEVVSGYDLEIIHRAGRSHANADALSRKPCQQCGRQSEGERKETLTSQTRVIQMSQEDNRVEIRQAQLEDANVRPILEAVENQCRPSKTESSAFSFKTKVLLEHWGQLEVRQGILYRKWESEDGKDIRWRLVLPKQRVADVLTELHAGSLAAHLGTTKTLKTVQRKYYWVGMKEDVRAFIRKCSACARRKTTGKKRRAPLQQRLSGSPMERIALDILGPLPESEKGNKYILVISDYYTKFVEAYPMPNETADTISRILVEEFICRYGIPREIHSDQGRQFESRLLQGICKILGIKKTRTTPFNPKSDGMVERFNRTLLSMLVTMIQPDKHQRDWDRYIPFATAAYRSSVHETINETPNMMMFGREVAQPPDLYIDTPDEREEVDYAEELRNKMDIIHSRVTEQSQKNLRRQKRNYDKQVAGTAYDPGKFVWLRNQIRKKGISPKLSYRWEGPYKVTDKLSDVTYRIQRAPRSKARIIHYDRLKSYEGTTPEEWTEEPIPNPRPQENQELQTESSGTIQNETRQTRYPKRMRRPPVFFYGNA